MKFIALIFCVLTTGAFASTSTERAPLDRESQMLTELQRTLETAAAAEDQKTPADAAILNRSGRQAADHPELRED